MLEYLYHGTEKSSLQSILDEGLSSPSYWGDLEIATRHAGEDGVVLRIEIDRFDPTDLRFNDLLAEELRGEGDDEAPTDGDWRLSLEALGSIRYDATLHVEADDIVDHLTDELSPSH